MAEEVSSRVVSSTQTWPGVAADCTRDAVFTASPATMPCCVAPTVTATSPVTTPTRIASPATPIALAEGHDGVDELEARRARRARRRPRARSGTPHTAITASPMNFSTVTAVAGDDPAALLEVAREQLAHVLLVAVLGERGEADQVAEQDAGHPS